MAQATLRQILDQLPTLDVEELRQLNQAIEKRLSPQEETRKREAFRQALLASGLVKEIKPPRRTEISERQLIEVQGQPVSKTIIEERR
jgi:hypothetical protein